MSHKLCVLYVACLMLVLPVVVLGLDTPEAFGDQSGNRTIGLSSTGQMEIIKGTIVRKVLHRSHKPEAFSDRSFNINVGVSEVGDIDVIKGSIVRKTQKARSGFSEHQATGYAVANNASCEARKVAEANARAKMAERNAWLYEDASPHERLAGMNSSAFHSSLIMAPYYPCPWSLAKTTSVKVRHDGGKWICGLPQLRSNRRHQVIYSIGSNLERSFEDTLLHEIGDNLEIHIYDPTIKDKAKLLDWTSKLPKQMHFHDMGITGEGAKPQFPAITLQEALKQNKHEQGADILKFDIESYEYELLDTTNWYTAAFGIISFELHANLIQHRRGGFTLAKSVELFKKLEDAGYRLYSAEPVCVGCTGQTELAWVHRDWDPTCGFSCSCFA